MDNGPPEKKHGKPKHGAEAQHAPAEAEGTVLRSLHGPKGEIRGALLEDGRIIRVPPHEAKACGPLLQPGARLAARGPGLTADGATVIDAKEIGASAASLRPVRPKKPEADGKHPKPRKDDGGLPEHA